MYWKIDRDYLAQDGDDLPSRVGWHLGTRDSADGEIMRFRGLDDDREVYYGGEADDLGLEPAYEFMYRDAGVTILQTRDKDGNWEDVIG